MKLTEYQHLAMRTQADQVTILDRIVTGGEQMVALDNASRGLAADAGEILDCIQKWIEYGQELDIINLKEEVGDCLWRLAQICKWSGNTFTLEEAAQSNIEKLQVRYPEKYKDELAQTQGRDLGAERKVLEQADQSTVETVKEGELEQTGQGWAEPPLELEKPVDSNNYDRVCEICNHHKIHTIAKYPICASCYGKTENQERIERIKNAYSK